MIWINKINKKKQKKMRLNIAQKTPTFTVVVFKKNKNEKKK